MIEIDDVRGMLRAMIEDLADATNPTKDEGEPTFWLFDALLGSIEGDDLLLRIATDLVAARTEDGAGTALGILVDGTWEPPASAKKLDAADLELRRLRDAIVALGRASEKLSALAESTASYETRRVAREVGDTIAAAVRTAKGDG